MNEAQKAAADAATQLAAVLNLPPASGTARNIVDAIVRAATAGVIENQNPVVHEPTVPPAPPVANFDQQRAKLGLPRKDRK